MAVNGAASSQKYCDILRKHWHDWTMNDVRDQCDLWHVIGTSVSVLPRRFIVNALLPNNLTLDLIIDDKRKLDSMIRSQPNT